MNKKGFTLTEILVVIVILGILVSVAVPLYINFFTSSREGTFSSLEDSMEVAANDYLLANLAGNGNSTFDQFENKLNNSEVVKVPLGILVETGHLPDVIDPDEHGTLCDYENSYVRILRVGNPLDRDYQYDAYLKCSEYTSDTSDLNCGEEGEESCLYIGNFYVKSTEDDYNATTVEVSFDQIFGTDMYISLTDKGDGSFINESDWENIDTTFTMNLTDYNSNIKLDGSSIKVYLYLRDHIGNVISDEFTYNLYNECVDNLVATSQSSWSDCTKTCGGGFSTQETFYEDTKSGNSCPARTTVATKSCNTHPCVSVSNFSAISTTAGYNGTNVRFRHVSTGGTSMIIKANNTIIYSGVVDTDITIDLANYGFTTNGADLVFTLTVSTIGSSKSLTSNYQLYSSCSSTNVSYGTYGSCSKTCGGGLMYRTVTYTDKYLGNVCSTTSQSTSCNTQTCVTISNFTAISTTSGYNGTSVRFRFTNSGGTSMVIKANNTVIYSGAVNTDIVINLANYGFTTNGANLTFSLTVSASGTSRELIQSYQLYLRCSSTNVSYSAYGNCTASCGGGLKYRTVTYTDKYVGGSCGSSSQSASCNTQTCCSSTYVSCGAWTVPNPRPIPWSENPDTRVCSNYSNYNGQYCSYNRTETRDVKHAHTPGVGWPYCIPTENCLVDHTYFNTYLKNNCGSSNYKLNDYNVVRPEVCSVCGEVYVWADASFAGGYRPINYCVYGYNTGGKHLGNQLYLAYGKNPPYCTFDIDLPSICTNR